VSLIANIRTVFTLGRGVRKGISELSVASDPLELFAEWFREARQSAILLPESMTLSTCTASGAPSARMVLLKGFDERGFDFYTNFESRKATELEENPRAALVLHWAVLQRQVRIEGVTERMDPEAAAEYFRTRPRGSQIGAWASAQSAVLATRGELEARVRELEEEYAGKEIPLPPFWGGYRVKPERIEFWQGRASRLHDRLQFERDGDEWTLTRLYP
jgi:pyridoxamine 5'-phosphate oxidase